MGHCEVLGLVFPHVCVVNIDHWIKPKSINIEANKLMLPWDYWSILKLQCFNQVRNECSDLA